MQWSKIRARLRACVCPELRKRVDFHLTNYREYGSNGHEVWITLDGEKIFSASYCDYMISENVLQRDKGLRTSAEGIEGKVAHDVLTRAETHDASITVYTFREYLDSDPQDALVSTDPVLKSLAIIDRRIGHRTLAKLKVGRGEHSLVRKLYASRLSAPAQST
jgi:hypothetical protein